MLAVRAECDVDCRALMSEILAIHRALGRESERLQLALVLPKRPSVKIQVPQLKIDIDAGLNAALAQQLGGLSSLYVVDPLGNVMLRYPRGFDPSGVHQDLERLLKYAKVGK